MAEVRLVADTSAYVAAVKRATKAAKKLGKALDVVERTPIVISVEST